MKCYCSEAYFGQLLLFAEGKQQGCLQDVIAFWVFAARHRCCNGVVAM